MSYTGQRGTFTGNAFLVPLFGGSGGGGGSTGTNGLAFGPGGGGGGGAILIASSVSITINGTISANGGTTVNNGNNNNLQGGSGAGGAIRLMAPLIKGVGGLSVNPGAPACCQIPTGFPGTIRLEAFQQQYNGSFFGNVTSGSPFSTLISSAPAAISVTSVGGVAVNPVPTGSFQSPDVTINNAAPVAVAIQAANVPVGTVVNLQFYSESGPDIITTSTPLAGTFASSTATAQVTFPAGFTRSFVYASFTSTGH